MFFFITPSMQRPDSVLSLWMHEKVSWWCTVCNLACKDSPGILVHGVTLRIHWQVVKMQIGLRLCLFIIIFQSNF